MSKEKPVSLKNLKLLGQEHLPQGGGFLILPSQLSYFDLLGQGAGRERCGGVVRNFDG